MLIFMIIWAKRIMAPEIGAAPLRTEYGVPGVDPDITTFYRYVNPRVVHSRVLNTRVICLQIETRNLNKIEPEDFESWLVRFFDSIGEDLTQAIHQLSGVDPSVKFYARVTLVVRGPNQVKPASVSFMNISSGLGVRFLSAFGALLQSERDLLLSTPGALELQLFHTFVKSTS
jgi:hypothetical protein